MELGWDPASSLGARLWSRDGVLWVTPNCLCLWLRGVHRVQVLPPRFQNSWLVQHGRYSRFSNNLPPVTGCSREWALSMLFANTTMREMLLRGGNGNLGFHWRKKKKPRPHSACLSEVVRIIVRKPGPLLECSMGFPCPNNR